MLHILVILLRRFGRMESWGVKLGRRTSQNLSLQSVRPAPSLVTQSWSNLSYDVLTDFNTQITIIFLFAFLLVANPTVFTGLVAKNHLAPSANYVEASGIVRRIPSVQVGRILIRFFVSRMIRLILISLNDRGNTAY
jgi:hypothetical protein